MEEIAKELLEVIRWIPKRELNSKYYIDYFDIVNSQLKKKH